jgi:hypothetical protein
MKYKAKEKKKQFEKGKEGEGGKHRVGKRMMGRKGVL